jgi:hypothetical protein
VGIPQENRHPASRRSRGEPAIRYAHALSGEALKAQRTHTYAPVSAFWRAASARTAGVKVTQKLVERALQRDARFPQADDGR